MLRNLKHRSNPKKNSKKSRKNLNQTHNEESTAEIARPVFKYSMLKTRVKTLFAIFIEEKQLPLKPVSIKLLILLLVKL